MTGLIILPRQGNRVNLGITALAIFSPCNRCVPHVLLSPAELLPHRSALRNQLTSCETEGPRPVEFIRFAVRSERIRSQIEATPDYFQPRATLRHVVSEQRESIMTKTTDDQNQLRVNSRDLNTDKLLCSKEVAAMLRFEPKTLANMRVKGTGPKFTKLKNRRVRYWHSDVQDWVAEQQILR